MPHVSSPTETARRPIVVSRLVLCALGIVPLFAGGCGSLRDRLAQREPEVSNAAGERALADLLVEDDERTDVVPSARQRPISGHAVAETRPDPVRSPRPLLWDDDEPLVPVTFEQPATAERATLVAPDGHGDPRAFQPARAPVNGRVRLTNQQLPAPDPVELPDEAFPGERRQVRIPTRGEGADEPRIDVTSRDDRISLVVRDAPIGTVVSLIAQQQGLNVISSDDIPTTVSVTLTEVLLDDALDTLLTVAGYTWVRRNGILVVSRISSENKLAPHLQGREVRVLPLSYVAATDVQKVVAGLLSPIGSVQVIESNSIDKRRTEESIVVEDLPGYLDRVTSYVAQIDQPPRQVLVEAHVLQVDLDEGCRHGVNFNYLSQLAGTDISVSTTGFANTPGAGSPSFALGLTNDDLNSLLEALKTSTDAKTLASPKVLVVNGQEARIQIGESLGYFVTTTTETSTLQNVEFLDLGIVLTVTPVISRDGRVLMTVKPEVSSGQINPVTGLPEEDTTEVQTTVMLGDGEAMIIGGLIKEEDSDRQSRIIGLGTLWGVGRLFTRRSAARRRQEVIVALIPRVVPICGPDAYRELEQIDRATTPLLTPDLKREFRPWEPQLRDAVHNPYVPWRR